MTHVLNSPQSFKDDLIEGLTRAYPQYLERIPGASGVRASGAPFAGHVSVLIGGGSGHYPAFAGLVGPGFATGAAMGDVFASPSSEQIYRCAKSLDAGAGVVFSYGNYSGDVMNFDMAAERLEDEDVAVATVLVTDDVASSPPERASDRRGIAGDFCVFKVLGAAARTGAGLEDVAELGRRANARTRSIGVAFAGCTLPGGNAPMFSVADDKMELGLGIHGEPGVRTISLCRRRILLPRSWSSDFCPKRLKTQTAAWRCSSTVSARPRARSSSSSTVPPPSYWMLPGSGSSTARQENS